MATVSDQQLIQHIQQGRREALAHLFDRYSADLYDFLARLVGDRDQAAILLEEAFTRVPGAVAGLPARESVQGWLYSLAREAGLTWLRQKGWLDALPPSEEPSAAGLGGDIWKAARAMPAFHRAILIVEELHALSPTEKARALGVQRTDLPRLIDEARKSFTRQFDAQARAEGRPTSAQIDADRILGLRRRIPAHGGTLFGLLPLLVMPDSLTQSLRKKVVDAMAAPPIRARVETPPVAEAQPTTSPVPPVTPTPVAQPQPIPQPIPTPVPVATTSTTTVTRRRPAFIPAEAPGCNLSSTAIAALIGLALAVLLVSCVYLLAFRDTTVPTVDRLDPPDGGSVAMAPLITVLASYHDDKSVDPARTKLLIDGADLSPLSSISQNAAAYSGALALGPHTATVSIIDASGNKRETTWRFTVIPAPTPTPTQTPLPTFVPPTLTPLPTSIPLATSTPLPTHTPVPPSPVPSATPVLPTSTPCSVGISGKAYNDINGNQARDAGEPNLSGVVLNLQNSSGGTISTAISDSFGTYQFAGLPFGTYRVQAALPSGWYATTPQIVTVNMFGCGAFLGIDFGFNQATPTPIPSFTPTFTPIFTQTPIIITATPNPSATPSFTPIIIVVTPTNTNPPPSTNTPTSTTAPTNTRTPTCAPTATGTVTPTATPTRTSTPTPTSTVNHCP